MLVIKIITVINTTAIGSLTDWVKAPATPDLTVVEVKIEIELDEADYIKYYKKMSNTDVTLGNVLIKKIDSVKNIIRKHDNIHKIITETKHNNNIKNNKEDIIEENDKDSSDDDIISTTPKKNAFSCAARP